MGHFTTNNSSLLIQKMVREYNRLYVENRDTEKRIADLEKMLAARDEQIDELKDTISHHQYLAEYFEKKYLDAVEWAEAYYTKLCSVDEENEVIQNKLEEIRRIIGERNETPV